MAKFLYQPTLGILGGGQLGRMIINAASNLGTKAVVWDSDGKAPAMQIADRRIIKSFDDESALKEFLSLIDVALIEWENIPTALIRKIERQKPTMVSSKILSISQSRIAEKKFFQTTKTPPANFLAIASNTNLATIAAGIIENKITFPAILKTDRMGYDGKGQFVVKNIKEIMAIIHKQSGDFILEQKINFIAEGSILVARDKNGKIICYPMVENKHKDGILATSAYPAKISPKAKKLAEQSAKQIAQKLKLWGILCIEFFILKNGKVYANEMAPRPHNSFHWTIEGTDISQFMQMVRIALGLPATTPTLHYKKITMHNILGDSVKKSAHFAKQSHLHLYGKDQAKPNRKMGHYTITKNK